MVHVRVGDVVEQQRLIDHSVYETIAPFRRNPFRALLYERELFVGQGQWSWLGHRRRHRLGNDELADYRSSPTFWQPEAGRTHQRTPLSQRRASLAAG